MSTRAWIAVMSLVVGACEATEVVFENATGRATLSNVRFVPDDPESVYEATRDLLPGQQSATITVLTPDEDESGRIDFELVVDGNRVALQLRDPVTPRVGETNIIVISDETKVINRLIDAQSARSSGTP